MIIIVIQNIISNPTFFSPTGVFVLFEKVRKICESCEKNHTFNDI